jgi:hypothetical protein
MNSLIWTSTVFNSIIDAITMYRFFRIKTNELGFSEMISVETIRLFYLVVLIGIYSQMTKSTAETSAEELSDDDPRKSGSSKAILEKILLFLIIWNVVFFTGVLFFKNTMVYILSIGALFLVSYFTTGGQLEGMENLKGSLKGAQVDTFNRPNPNNLRVPNYTGDFYVHRMQESPIARQWE